MIRQCDRLCVLQLLKEIERSDLKRYVGKVWEELEVEEGEEKTSELCFNKLLELYPEKIIYGKSKKTLDYGTDDEEWDGW